MTKAHTLSASQVVAFTNVLRSQETIEPMIPGRATVVLPAKLARARPRACRCFIHSLTPPLSDSFGAGDGVPPAPPPVTARTRVLIAMPIAVRMLAMVMPCSWKSVWIHSASVLSSWRSRLMVSQILLNWVRRAAMFGEKALSLACISSSRSERSPSSFFIRSGISYWISGSSVSVSFLRSLAMCFLTSDLRSLTSDSFAWLLASSSLALFMTSRTPASCLVAWVTHGVSIGGSSMVFNAALTSPIVPMTSLAAPVRSFSSMDSVFLRRVSSAL